MFKFIFALCVTFVSFAAFARYPDGKCTANETKLIYEKSTTFGKRTQISNPMFCANGQYYSILAYNNKTPGEDHVAGLCTIYGLGSYVNYDFREFDHEELAIFDDQGNFNGTKDFNSNDGELYYAVKALTCQLP